MMRLSGPDQPLPNSLNFWYIFHLLTTSFINPVVFGSIVVSISACHSKEQLAGGRGSIPRQRDIFFAITGQFFFIFEPDGRDFCGTRLESHIDPRLGLA
jgi:hypothetical protein